MSILRLHEVHKSFGHLCAVDGVSFSLEQGENLGLVGESGCGKTTLAKMIMGLIKPDKGSIEAQAGGLQMVFQDPYQSLDPLWNVREILKEGLSAKKSLLGRHCEEQSDEAIYNRLLRPFGARNDEVSALEQILVAVGLSPDVLNRFPHEFSGGERQRIAIARALLAGPKALVLDEAVSALDTLVQKQIIDLLKSLKRDFGLAYIFISHNLRLVRYFSDKILVMRQGKIVEAGSSKDVMERPVHPYTQELVQAIRI